MIPLWVYAAGGLGIAAIAFGGGWSVRDWKADSDALEAVEKANAARDAAVAQAHTASASYEADRAVIEVQAATARNTVREIYRDVQVSADCAVQPDALRLLDNAIAATGAASSEPSAAVPATADAS